MACDDLYPLDRDPRPPTATWAAKATTLLAAWYRDPVSGTCEGFGICYACQFYPGPDRDAEAMPVTTADGRAHYLVTLHRFLLGLDERTRTALGPILFGKDLILIATALRAEPDGNCFVNWLAVEALFPITPETYLALLEITTAGVHSSMPSLTFLHEAINALTSSLTTTLGPSPIRYAEGLAVFAQKSSDDRIRTAGSNLLARVRQLQVSSHLATSYQGPFPTILTPGSPPNPIYRAPRRWQIPTIAIGLGLLGIGMTYWYRHHQMT